MLTLSNHGGSYARVGTNPANRRTSDTMDRRSLSRAAVRRCPICMEACTEDSAFCSPLHRNMFAEKVQRAADEQRIDHRSGRMGPERPGPYKASTRGARYKRKTRAERTNGARPN